MKDKFINEIIIEMNSCINDYALEKLKNVLDLKLKDYSLGKNINNDVNTNNEYIELFLTSKKIEGCSNKTLKYYKMILNNFFNKVEIDIKNLNTEDLRTYLNEYQRTRNNSRVSIDNIRRVFSSFFNWLENENYILKSPMRRIHKIKTIKNVKDTYSTENLQLLKDNTKNLRDLAIIETLASTGMRVGELVLLNRFDIDFINKECVVFGKGGKERRVYFDSTTKLHLQNYLESRKDDNDALFVSLLKPYRRLEISGVEIMLRKIGKSLGLKKVHPHKFRRTLATSAIDKGMPIEQVQRLLGHSKIDTTMNYAMVDQNNVKISYRKFLD